jgi:hypothetical protein
LEAIDDLKTFNSIKWWHESFPPLHFYAFDTLAILAMSAECERVFSGTKKLITPDRNRVTEEISSRLNTKSLVLAMKRPAGTASP